MRNNDTIVALSASDVLDLLVQIDNGHIPSTEEKRYLTKIVNLDLSGQSIRKLPDSLGMLTSLLSLNLRDNMLDELPGAIGQLRSLQILDIRSNDLSTLPNSMVNLGKLEGLDISMCSFEQFPMVITQLSALQNLCAGYNSFVYLPTTLFQMKHLRNLDISGSDIKELPEELGRLKELQTLDISANSISHLPESIGDLKSLQTFDADGNQLSSLPASFAKLTTLRALHLRYNLFAECPSQISHLTSLEELVLSENKLHDLPNLSKLTSLQRLDIGQNEFFSLPECVKDLGELQELYINDNLLRSLPDWLTQLVKIDTLVANDNLFTAIPDCISMMSSLRTLNLNNNYLSTLPAWMDRLTALEALHIRGNAISIFPEVLLDLSTLRILNIRKNALTQLPEGISRLSNLEEFNLTENGLDSLPAEIGLLKKLKKLGLGNNKLSVIPETLAEIPDLQELYLWENMLQEFPSCIFELEHLSLLEIGSTQLPEIPSTRFRSKNIRKIDFSDSKLHSLPSSLLDLNLPFLFERTSPSQVGILLENTDLATQPVSLFQQPRELIQAYYNMEKTPVNEGKVIFLGHGDVGKSYSIQRILNHDEPGHYDTQMTPGISISYFPVEQNGRKFDLCFWDFGGQEIMHAMHRYFLTHRTCYVVMVSNRLPNVDEQARYWLRNVESFAGGSDVLLVVNQWEDYPSNTELNYTQLKTDFKNLVGYVSISAKCDDKQTFNKLTEAIINMAAKLDSTGMDFPVQWYSIRQTLQKMADNGKYYINRDEYYQICQQNDLNNPNIRMWLLEWFNDLGTCFSYHQDTKKEELEEYKVLNPEWLTNAIYILILNGKLFTQNGVILRSGIESLLSNPTGGTLSDVTYTPEECGYVLEVMRKFTLSYAVSDTEEFIPALCPNETPQQLYPSEYTNHLRYELEYKYLPDSVVHQLMIYCYQYLNLDKCWRKGMSVNIQAFGLSAVVSMGGSDKLLTIDVYSAGQYQLWHLLQPLLDAIGRINSKLNLKAVDYVYVETTIDGKTYTDRFSLEHILSVKSGNDRRKPSSFLQGKEVDHSIDKLLLELYRLPPNQDDFSKSKDNEHDESKLTPTILNQATLNYCTIVFNQDSDIRIHNTDIPIQVLETILMNQEKMAEEFLNEFADILVAQKDDIVRQLGTDMQTAKKKRKSVFAALKSGLEGAGKMTTIASNLASAMPLITKLIEKWPDICGLFKGILPIT